MEIIAFCAFLHHFLQFLKEKRSLSSFLSFLKIARLWDNEISPSPGGRGLTLRVRVGRLWSRKWLKLPLSPFLRVKSENVSIQSRMHDCVVAH